MVIVGVCGFGSTGSGAVVDFLREFPDEVSAGKNLEMSFLYDPDGVLDLEYRLVKQPVRFYSGDAAIKRFRQVISSYDLKKYISRYMPYGKFMQISKDYLSDLVACKWDGGLWTFDRRQASRAKYFFKYTIGHKYLRIFDKLHVKQPQHFFGDRMYIPVHDERFYTATRRFTSRLIQAQCDTSKKCIVLDQPFPSNHPSLCYSFFENECKSIIVNRDPRDLYLITKMNPCGWELRFTPSYSVEDFVAYYRDIMYGIQLEDVNSLYIQFEDLVYDYDNATQKIKEFLDIKGHTNPKEKFNPAVSIANTQMKLRYPDQAEDVEYIERELKEYLYPFDEDKADLSAEPWNFMEEG